MNQRVVLMAVLALSAYWLVSWVLYDFGVGLPIPIIGDLFALYPFQLLEPYALFIGGGLVLLVFYLNRQKRRARKS